MKTAPFGAISVAIACASLAACGSNKANQNVASARIEVPTYPQARNSPSSYNRTSEVRLLQARPSKLG